MASIALDHAIGLSGGVPSGLHALPDGDTFAVAVGANVVVSRLRDPSSQGFLRGPGQVCAIALSPSGKLLASGHADVADVVLWDVAGRAPRFRLQEHDGQVTALAFSDDDRVLMSAATDGSCVFWDCVSGGVIARRRAEQTPTLSLAYAGFVVDGKGRDVALYQFVSAGAKSASVWGLDPAAGALAAERVTAPGMVRDYVCSACSPAHTRRQWLYLGTANGDVCVLHIASRAVVASVFAGGGGVCSLRCVATAAGGEAAAAPDSVTLIAGCGDGTVLVLRHSPPPSDRAPGGGGGGALSAAMPHAAGAIASRMGVGTGEGRASAQTLVPVSSVALPGGAVWGLAPLSTSGRLLSCLASTSGGALYTVNSVSGGAQQQQQLPLAAVPHYGRRGGSFSAAAEPARLLFSSTAAAPEEDEERRVVAAEVLGKGLVGRLALQAHGAGRDGIPGAAGGSLPSALALGATGGVAAVASSLPPAMAASLRGCDVVAVAFASNVGNFVTAASDNSVRVWESGSLRCANTVTVRDAGHPTCAAFVTADFTVTGWQDGCLRAHATAPLASGAAPVQQQQQQSYDSFDSSRRMRHPASASGAAAAAGAGADLSLLWSLPDAHGGRDGGVTVVAPAQNQRFFVSGGGDGAVRLWDARSRELVTHLKEHMGAVTGLAMFRDDVHVVSVGHDRNLMCWDLRREKRVSQHAQRSGGFNAVALARDQSLVVTTGQERSLTFWDLRAAAPVKTVAAGGSGEVAALAAAHGHDVLAAAGADGVVRLWDLRQARVLQESPGGHSGAARQVAFAPDDRQLVSVGSDGAVLVWNVFM